jgi:hypothetical protein
MAMSNKGGNVDRPFEEKLIYKGSRPGIVLIYVGDHTVGEYLSDVPPRDLSQNEIEACGYSVEKLIETGFYATPAEGESKETPK